MTIQTMPWKQFDEEFRGPVLKRGGSEVDVWGAQHGFRNDMSGWRGHGLVEGDRISRLYAIRGRLVVYIGGGYLTETVYAIVEEFITAGNRRIDLDALRERLAVS